KPCGSLSQLIGSLLQNHFSAHETDALRMRGVSAFFVFRLLIAGGGIARTTISKAKEVTLEALEKQADGK
ncbi:MAG: hypothetical protein CL919_04335, partial [Deltaproteobacteria bacterium]|nr:hypothetical protein [Deltaproteobacteria bacterium]